MIGIRGPCSLSGAISGVVATRKLVAESIFLSFVSLQLSLSLNRCYLVLYFSLRFLLAKFTDQFMDIESSA